MDKNELKSIKEDVRKEFQVERMILFSDAVFAIVITLMAIEIKLPHSEQKLTEELFFHQCIHLLPIVFAYAVSFFFVGLIWYRHLKIFSVVKTYDLRLIVHNLSLLFFVGLFPFGASFVSGGQTGYIIRLSVYFGIIISCLYAQFFLQHYVLIKKPELREEEADINELMDVYKKSVPSLFALPLAFSLTAITYFIVDNPELRGLSSLWIMIIPLAQLIYKKRNPKFNK